MSDINTIDFVHFRFSFQCEDIDECRIGQHNCNLVRHRCINFPGSFKCVSIGEEQDNASNEEMREGNYSIAKAASLKFMVKLCEVGYVRNEGKRLHVNYTFFCNLLFLKEQNLICAKTTMNVSN